ncbi:hypothetical protein BpHYR1_003826 [Brachionus plicatilis]|uniref:Uncharacterized protein n=1 Tax=Brachionus plicatilis TaxID=10195 RepID=A0A3M7RT33_BRAPC|nr:hypothetical protein BpHYR1_003826 [Brachionus plicatilis]
MKNRAPDLDHISCNFSPTMIYKKFKIRTCVAVVYFITFVAERFSGKSGLKLSNFSQWRVANKFALRRSVRHVKVDASVLAISVKRLLDPLGSKGQIYSFTVSGEKKSQSALRFHRFVGVKLKKFLHISIFRIVKSISVQSGVAVLKAFVCAKKLSVL